MFAEKTHEPAPARTSVLRECDVQQNCIYLAIFSRGAPRPCRNPAAASSIYLLYCDDDARLPPREKSLMSNHVVASANRDRRRHQRCGMWDRTRPQLPGMICE